MYVFEHLRKFDILGQNEGLDYLIENVLETNTNDLETNTNDLEHLEKLYTSKPFMWDSKMV